MSFTFISSNGGISINSGSFRNKPTVYEDKVGETLTGSNMTIRRARSCVITGSNNYVDGAVDCNITGSNVHVRAAQGCRITGSNANVEGDNNIVTGSNAVVTGKNNQVTGVNAISNGAPVSTGISHGYVSVGSMYGGFVSGDAMVFNGDVTVGSGIVCHGDGTSITTNGNYSKTVYNGYTVETWTNVDEPVNEDSKGKERTSPNGKKTKRRITYPDGKVEEKFYDGPPPPVIF